MVNKDISLKTDHGRFNYRVGAIIIHDHHLLMVKNVNFPYYYSVGGRVRFGELSTEAVLREVVEETQVNMEIERLAFVHENLFIGDIKNQPWHEIAFFYWMKPAKNLNFAALSCNSHAENGATESLHWLPLDKLSNCPLFPEFFKTELLNRNEDVGHFITKDEITFRVTS